MDNKTSENVLASATALLGFCFVVITSIHLTNRAENSIVDELTSVVSVLLIFACIGSFVAIRSNDRSTSLGWGKVADYLFILSLLGILGIIVLVAFNYLP